MAETEESTTAATIAEAAAKAQPVLEGSPFSLVAIKNERPPNPRLLLGGSPLSSAEVRGGHYVRRRVRTASGEHSVDDLFPWLLDWQGHLVLLTAQAGEGKTSLMNTLASCAAPYFVPIRWDTRRPFDRRPLRAFQETVHSFPLPDPPPGMLVLAEIPAGLDSATSVALADSLALREAERDSFVVLLSGRHSDLRPLRVRVSTEEISLAALNVEEARDLVEQITTAAESVARSASPGEMERRYPNLETFLARTTDAKVRVLSTPGKPLLVGLLEAVYGENFRRRLIQEFEKLDDADRAAYLHVCLVTAAGESVASDFLARLCPEANIDERSRFDPWARNESGHRARHRVIAQTVIEESETPRLLAICLEDWAKLIGQSRSLTELARRVIDQAGRWMPVAPQRTGPFRGVIRRAARRALNHQRDKLQDVPDLFPGDHAAPLRWAATVHELLPRRSSLGEPHIGLLQEYQQLLEMGQEQAKRNGAPDSTLERIGYYLEKCQRDIRRARGEGETVDQVEDRLDRWAPLINRTWPGPDFYSDFFYDAASRARALTTSGEVERDSQTLREAYEWVVDAYERLRLLSDDAERFRGSQVEYSKLISRLIYYALPDSHPDVIERAWQISEQIDPNPQTGTAYAVVLADAGDVEGARRVLSVVLSARPYWGEALLRFVLLGSEDEHRSEASTYIEESRQLGVEGLNLAYLNHAEGLLSESHASRAPLLSAAVDGYSEYVDNRSDWEACGWAWEMACEQLNTSGNSEVQSCSESRLERARESSNQLF